MINLTNIDHTLEKKYIKLMQSHFCATQIFQKFCKAVCMIWIRKHNIGRTFVLLMFCLGFYVYRNIYIHINVFIWIIYMDNGFIYTR